MEEIDKNLKKIINETMGTNVYRQIITVEPDFFSGKYIITKLVEKPEIQQKFGQFVRLCEPKIVASTHPEYSKGIIFDNNKLFEIIKQGYNFTISPNIIRDFMTDESTLSEGPLDGLVIAGIKNEKLYPFYVKEGSMGNPKHIYAGLRTMVMKDYFPSTNCFTFAFTKDKGQEQCYIDDYGWKLKTISSLYKHIK